MPTKPDPGNYEDSGQSWRACYGCGELSNTVELNFTNGATTPVIGETVTGLTSKDTGVVTEVNVRAGTFPGATAIGTLVVNNYTGTGTDGFYFSDGELLSGSISGQNILVADGDGIEKKTGMMFPRSRIVKYKGVWYCPYHLDIHLKWDAINDVLKPTFQDIHDDE